MISPTPTIERDTPNHFFQTKEPKVYETAPSRYGFQRYQVTSHLDLDLDLDLDSDGTLTMTITMAMTIPNFLVVVAEHAHGVIFRSYF